MKCDRFCLPAIIVITVLACVILLGACKSTPKPEEPDVWTLLAKGDESAKDFFIGEVDVHAKDLQGRTPLHYAAELDHPGLAAFFIAMGADVDAEDNSRQTPLGICADMNTVNAALIIVKAGANIHKSGGTNMSPAVIAVRNNNDFLQVLLTPESVDSVDHTGKTILHIAAETGSVQAVKTILAAIQSYGGSVKNPIDRLDNEEHNPLDIALAHPESRNHMEAAEQLILSGAVSDNAIFDYFAPAVRNANYNIRRADGQAPLHYAAADGYEGLIRFLLERKADINIKNAAGGSPLHEAVRSGNVNIITLILENGADINAQDAKGNSPLHIAAPTEQHSAVIKTLLDAKANPNLRDEHGDTPLHILVLLNRSEEIVKTLLHGNSQIWVDASVRNMNGKTPLYLAVQENRDGLIPPLLTTGSDIFAADNSGVTPFDLALRIKGAVLDKIISQITSQQKDSAGNTMLHIAVRGRADTVIIAKILAAKDLPINARNREGDTALHIAARMNLQETGEYIISHEGVDIFSFNSAGESPLYIALTTPPPNGVLHWMFSEKTLISRDGLGNSMLHYAALWNMDSHIKFIIEKGIAADTANATGETPLFWAVKYDGVATVRALIAAGADRQIRDQLGNSALHAAVRWNAMNSTIALLDAGIDVNVHNLNRVTPLHDSVRFGLTNIASTLIVRGADIEVRDSGGNTPFMEAVRGGYIESVNLLYGYGANPMTRNSNGDTPLHFAAAAGQLPLINSLLEMGCSIHARNTKNRTPFQAALYSPQMVSAMLAKNRANLPDDYGNSPLHTALIEKAPAETLQLIVDSGTSLSSVDSNGRTALRLAADLNNWDAAKILADRKSDPFSVAVDNKTPAETAIAAGSDAIKAIFSGSAIGAKDALGNNILHYAAKIGSRAAVTGLLELNADKEARNISGERPAEVAIRWGKTDIAAMLN